MTHYRITLLSPRGEVIEEQCAEYRHDDEAIDRTGALTHPDQILLHQGSRLVGAFPSLKDCHDP